MAARWAAILRGDMDSEYKEQVWLYALIPLRAGVHCFPLWHIDHLGGEGIDAVDNTEHQKTMKGSI